MTDTQSTPTRAAIYVRVSTRDQADEGWSLEDQRKEGHRQIDGHADWTYVGIYDDGGRHGDREDQDELERLLAAASSGEIDVVVTKAMDRFGRNDGEIAATLELLNDAGVDVYVGGRQLDFESPEGNLHTGIERLFADYERRKIRARTRAGLRERKESGQAVGPIPIGYTFEEYEREDGKTKTRRVIDDSRVGLVRRVFDLVEGGTSVGEVARILNREGIRTRPRKDHPEGTTWGSRSIRKIVHNDSYTGRNGYPQIIDPERFNDIQEDLTRLAKVRHGRKPVDDSFFLRGIANCTLCGARLYTRRLARGREYICQNVRQATGLCDAPPIPAELLESHVLRHLDAFVGSVESWLTERIEERGNERRERERALDRERAQLAKLDRERDRHLATYRTLAGRKAEIQMEVIEQVETEIADSERRIADGEAKVSEWSAPPDVDAALDFYNDLVAQVQGRIVKAEGSRELHETLAMVVAGLWAEVEEDRERLLVEFELVKPVTYKLLGGEAILPEFRQRPTLPPRMLDDRIEPEPLSQEGPLGFVYVQPVSSRISRYE